MEKLDFEKYDKISKIELIIEDIIRKLKLDKVLIKLATESQQKQFTLTILSILYKQKYYQEYLKKHVIEFEQDNDIKILQEIIDAIKQPLEEDKIIETIYIIKNYGYYIQFYLEMYFQKKRKNYITEKHSTKLIFDQNKQKEILEINPYMINQLLSYLQKPLTKEETMIEEIMEFQMEASQTYQTEEKMLEYIKTLMKNNYNEEQLNETIAFIISIVYQKIIEDYNDQNRNIIKGMIENEKIDKNKIIEHFKNANSFSNKILNRFIMYVNKIEKGYLEELEHKESKKYAKKIYDK